MKTVVVRHVVLCVTMSAAWQPLGALADDSSSAMIVPVAGQAWRVWQDDSGYHRVRGKLIGIGDQGVRVLKENQRVTTVPLIRLSSADRLYVAQIHVVLKRDLPFAEPGRELASPTTVTPESPATPSLASITLSREFLGRFVEDVDRRQPVSTTILGVPIRGWARTQASTSLVLIPDARKAVLEIPVRGQVTSQTVGNVSVAKIHTNSLTDFEKRLRINLSEAGVTVEPLELSTENRYINSTVSTSAWAMPGLVTRIANRRVQATKPTADQIARRQERDRINHAFETVAAENVGRVNTMLREFLLANSNTALVRDATIGFSTTTSSLRIAVTSDDAPRDLPPPPAVDHDLPMVVQMHASLFLKAMQASADDEMTARLEQLAAGESAALQAIRQEIETGTFSSEWNDDESWLTITWQPASATTNQSVLAESH